MDPDEYSHVAVLLVRYGQSRRHPPALLVGRTVDYFFGAHRKGHRNAFASSPGSRLERTRVPMIVMKFGGTSLESVEAIERVCSIVKSRGPRHPVVVVSAL